MSASLSTQMTLSQLIETGSKAIDKVADDLDELSQKIWSTPELRFEEKSAHSVLTSYFEQEGFQVSKHTPIETAFIAKYGHDDGVKVGIMCEYDALPGIGHACGHNLIAEAGAGAGIGLKAILEANPDIKAQVVVFGTPGEEGGGGKVVMIEKGCFDDMDVCMMSHPAPFDSVTFPCLARCSLKIVYHGKEAHAAACPWVAKNALDAAVQCYNNVSMLRQQVLPTCRVYGVITDGGVKPNIIPQRSELYYDIAAPTFKVRDELKERVMCCVNAAATATGCIVEVEEPGVPYSELKNSHILNALYGTHAKSIGVNFVDANSAPEEIKYMAASTDMGNVSHVKPSIHPIFKIGDAMNHTEKFTKLAGHPDAQQPTLNSAKAMMMTGIEVISDSDLLKRIKEEFARSD